VSKFLCEGWKENKQKDLFMVDLHTILADHRSSRSDRGLNSSDREVSPPTIAKIPDIFFDHILIDFKLSRIETLVMMYLYRKVWCRPNLYKIYGISPLMSHTEMSHALAVTIDDIYQSLRKLEDFGFITTVRSGQYFVRKYFTKAMDELYSQNYDDFEE
jgi:DNA-binding MarR family transcriptional regulator